LRLSNLNFARVHKAPRGAKTIKREINRAREKEGARAHQLPTPGDYAHRSDIGEESGVKDAHFCLIDKDPNSSCSQAAQLPDCFQGHVASLCSIQRTGLHVPVCLNCPALVRDLGISCRKHIKK